EADSVREHAHNLVAMADMTIRSTEKVGRKAVDGNFDEGSTVEVADDEGSVFARGMVAVSAADLRGVIGRRTGDLPEGMTHEVIHRDDLVVLPS
ncbi:MAG: PUA domain-containing protein, partial [Ilumatobacteraceae bacterium]